MLIAIDIGNSRIKIGVFDGDRLHSKLSLPTSISGSHDELDAALGTITGCPIDAAIACSVVPHANEGLSDFIDTEFGVTTEFVKNTDDLGLDIRYAPVDAAGTDRLVNAFAAVEKYTPPCLVCSFGTATTIDVIDRDHVLLGGLIAAGMRTSAIALEMEAARLPEVAIERPTHLIATTTVEAIRSGIYFSQVGLVEACIDRIGKLIGDRPKVIATGGFAPLIVEGSEVIDIFDAELTLEGLRMLYSRRHSRA